MTISLTKGAVVKIDESDYELVKHLKWHLSSTGYAVWRGNIADKRQTIRMHRLLTNAPDDLVVDHINHDTLDNRRSNLRVCTQSDNLRNMTNQGKGYWFHKLNKNWCVEVHGLHRGTFQTESEARDFAALVRAGLVVKKPKVVSNFCKYGHSLVNSYDYGNGKKCKECQARRSREYHVRKTKQENV